MPNSRQADALIDLINEIRSSFHLLKALAREVHGGSELTAARRGVMLDLLDRGNSTVPELARIRPVSRQHIQVVVNGLLGEGWVELRPNPAHRKSRLVSLTPDGSRVVRQMLQREKDLLGSLDWELETADITRAAGVLRETRKALAQLRP